MEEKKHLHTISVLVENKFGVLARVAGLFSGRGYNIASLTVNSTMDPEVSQMTIVTYGDDAVMEQIDKQLRKLINVIQVDDLTGGDFIERELGLFKIATPDGKSKDHIAALVAEFSGKTRDFGNGSLGVEITGASADIDAFIQRLKGFNIVQMARSGRVAIAKK